MRKSSLLYSQTTSAVVISNEESWRSGYCRGIQQHFATDSVDCCCEPFDLKKIDLLHEMTNLFGFWYFYPLCRQNGILCVKMCLIWNQLHLTICTDCINNSLCWTSWFSPTNLIFLFWKVINHDLLKVLFFVVWLVHFWLEQFFSFFLNLNLQKIVYEQQFMSLLHFKNLNWLII